jgi:hypothetical protein
MNFQDLRDNLLAQFKILMDRAEESAAYQQLKDRYENLNPNMQKAVTISAVVVIVLIFVSSPWGSLMQSVSNIDDFLARRGLIRELLKTAKEANEVPEIPVPPPMDSLKSRIQTELQASRVMQDLIKSVETVPVGSKLFPQELSDGTVEVVVNKLNLKQIVDVGQQLTAISPSVKMKDMIMNANAEDERYYDVIYRLIVLKVPEIIEPLPDPEPPKKGSK